MVLKQKLLSDAQKFCENEGISLSRLSSIVVNNGVLFKRLKKGGDCKTEIYERFQMVFNNPAAWAKARKVDSKRRAA